MLSEKQCIDYCDLSEEEITAIAEHKKIPEVLATELGECLLKSDVGAWLIKRYIADDLDRAQLAGRNRRVEELRQVLENFCSSHPSYELR